VTATTETVTTTTSTTTAVAGATKTTTTYGGGKDVAMATAMATTATVTATTTVVIPPYLTHLIIHDTPLHINNMYYYYDCAQTQKISHFDAVSYVLYDQSQYLGDTQTKHRDDCPWYGDDVDVPTLGVALVWAMVWAIAAGHHGAR
jgi:hypothetical protein